MSLALPSSPGADWPAATAPHLRECSDCGQLQVVPAMPPAARARCIRCDTVLRHTHHHPIGVPLAWNFTALILLAIAAGTTMLSVSTFGFGRSADLFSGPVGLGRHGMWELAAVVLFTTFAAPLVKLVCTTAVLLGLCMQNPPGWLAGAFAWARRLQPWSMVEIYLLGFFVAYVRLGAVVKIDLGPATFALGALMLAMVAADFALDPHAIWEEIGHRTRPSRARRRRRPRIGATERIGCDQCGLVTRAVPGAACPRCHASLRQRKPLSFARTWAFGMAAVILYIPANAYPVMSITRLGWSMPSTIIGGVEELIKAGMWPLAALVFFASIVVPGMKLIILTVLLVSTQIGARRRLRDRTRLYRLVDAIGRWSMIDIFMGSLLVALLQFGVLATVLPGVGALAFASVVILTMLAAQSFDPRLMWDAAGTQAEYDA
jgi:paraquat-inducible protein A